MSFTSSAKVYCCDHWNMSLEMRVGSSRWSNITAVLGTGKRCDHKATICYFLEIKSLYSLAVSGVKGIKHVIYEEDISSQFCSQFVVIILVKIVFEYYFKKSIICIINT